MVDWCKEVMGFLAFALLVPESGETGSSTEFPGFCLLVLGYRNGLMETGFRFRGIVRRLLQQEFTFKPIEFCFAPPFASFVCLRQRFCECHETCLWLPYGSMDVSE